MFYLYSVLIKKKWNAILVKIFKWNHNYNVFLLTSEISVSSIQFTENKSPKQVPIFDPFIISSGGQYVGFEFSEGLAADRAYMLVLVGNS